MDPRLILAIDNCFAYKRWVKPIDWMLLIRDMGLTFVEQSADTECDPLYMGPDYMREWVDIVRAGTEKTGVRVKNLYSGHGTYSTCGLAHWHDGVRLRFRDQWMKPQADVARALDAGFGFFAHAFEYNMLQSDALYTERLNVLYDDLAELARYARSIGLGSIGLEQMYTPHMPPWTIRGAREMLTEVFRRAGAPMYVTLDLGHMNGQQYFRKPTPEALRESLERDASEGTGELPWLGSDRAGGIYRKARGGALSPEAAVGQIMEDVERHPHLFSEPQDGDIWAWVRALGKYAPIVHLQQTDGKSSPHWPFSRAYNRKGVCSGEKLIESLVQAFAEPEAEGMPAVVGEVVLTLEPFVGTMAIPGRAVDEIAESVAYWRRFIPRDGMRLSEARELLAGRAAPADAPLPE